ALETFWIDANDSFERRIVIPVRWFVRFDRLVVRLHNAAADYTLERAIPVRRLKIALISAIAGAAVAACAGTGFWLEHPHRIVRVVRGAPVTRVVRVPGPSVTALALDQSDLHPHDPLVVRYAVHAQRGSLRVVDVNGTVWARAPLSPTGVSTIPLPVFAHDKELRVELLAAKNGTSAASSVGFAVRATPSPAPIAKTAATDKSSPIAIDETSVSAGQSVAVRIAAHPPNLHLAFTTQGGQTLQDVDVAPDQKQVLFSVPLDAQGRIVVVASFKRGQSQEVVVQSVPVKAVR
ncbi:MAG: hypothetical protein M3R35_06295, partial [Candidatus Eremiobacteraeota bacterium]|nr:hypothetical protein [Candidatus Eremiobacteraeota bacterium]